MKSITIAKAETDLREIIQDVLDDLEPTIVTTEGGDSVVMLSLDEYNAWQETLYLLSTPANADHLRQSIAEDKARTTPSYQITFMS
jgi:antitoxin YefM